MKKTKILTVLGVLLAMGITACGGNKASSKSEEKSSQSQSQPASSVAPAPASSSSQPASTPDTSAPEQGSSSSSSAVAHVHVWNLPNKDELEAEYAEIDPAPTCTEAGVKTWYCECGETKTEAVKKLGHDFGEWTEKTAATCTVDGVEERACKRAGCTEKETRAIKAAHDWDEAQVVEAGTDPANQVGYTLASCKVCHAIKAEIIAKDAKFYKGSIKSGTPSSSFKLNSKNDKAYWRFTLAGTKMYKGMLYQYAAMDSWSGNTERTYAQTSTSGDHAPTYPLGNFDAIVNGDRLDKSQWIDTPYSELLAEGDDSSTLMGDNFSPVALAPMGECVIQPGTNEITYERLGSYNLIINKLVFIGSEYEHTHVAATEWTSDADGHWHACTEMGCPNGKADAPVAHTFEEKAEDARNKAATCSEEGAKVEKCSVCGYEKVTPIAKIAHTYPNDGAYTQTKAPTCTEAGEKERQCSVCNAKDVQPVPALGHTFGDAVENYAAVTEGENQHIAATAHNCSVCEKSALRWSALDYDKTLSSGTSEVKVNGSATNNAVKTGNAENDGGQNNANPAVSVGNHYVYKVNVGAAVEKAGLSFRIFTRTSAYPVFKTQSNDGKRGNYYDESTQTFTAAPARYGVRINGQEVYFDEDLLAAEGNAATSKDLWFDFPLQSFSLVEGVNTIDVYSMGGYSQQGILEFQVTGLAHVTPSHLHNGGDAWVSDNADHWHACTAEGCPIADGVYDKAAHDWNDVVEVTAPTCTTAGAGTKECKICHKVVDVEIPALGHNISAGAAVKNSVDKDVAPLTCSRGDVEGYEIALADYEGTADAIASDGKLAKSAEMTWKFKLTADGEGHYRAGTVSFIMCAKLNGGMTGWGTNQTPADTAFANDYSLKVGEKSGTVTCAGKQLGANFGATVDDAVYFEFGTIAFEESDLVNGELVITVTQAANQGYRFRYQDNVRIIYIA